MLVAEKGSASRIRTVLTSLLFLVDPTITATAAADSRLPLEAQSAIDCPPVGHVGRCCLAKRRWWPRMLGRGGLGAVGKTSRNKTRQSLPGRLGESKLARRWGEEGRGEESITWKSRGTELTPWSDPAWPASSSIWGRHWMTSPANGPSTHWAAGKPRPQSAGFGFSACSRSRCMPATTTARTRTEWRRRERGHADGLRSAVGALAALWPVSACADAKTEHTSRQRASLEMPSQTGAGKGA